MGPELEIANSLRTEYAFLFSALVRFCEIGLGETPSMKFDDIKGAVSKLASGGFLSECLKENLDTLFKFYPELESTKIASEYKKNADATEQKLESISRLVRTIIGDVYFEIQEISEESKKPFSH